MPVTKELQNLKIFPQIYQHNNNKLLKKKKMIQLWRNKEQQQRQPQLLKINLEEEEKEGKSKEVFYVNSIYLEGTGSLCKSFDKYFVMNSVTI